MNSSFSQSIYKNISLDELVTYCVFILHEEKKEVTFENLVAKCFSLFPDKFSLVGYPQWPDSARVNKSWLRCRTDFKYIRGNVKTGFTLTSKGLYIAEKVVGNINASHNEVFALKKRKAKERTKEEQFIRDLEGTEAFKTFTVKGQDSIIGDFEFCDMLYCTLESSPEALKSNLDILKGYAQVLDRKDILDFLIYAENQHKNKLFKVNGAKKYVGGMNKKRNRGGRNAN